MKIKTGDIVQILTGKDKGKTGKVLQVFIDKGRASVEGLNLLIKHMRPRREGEKGQRIEFPAAMDISNLSMVCPKCSKVCRVGYKYEESKGSEADKGSSKKVRYCKKCQANID